MRTDLLVIGMKDNGCRERVIEALSSVEGVTEVMVSLLRARAMVWHEPSCLRGALIQAIERAGYGVSGP